MGDVLSMGEALKVTLFSMLVVFIGLIGLSLCISVLKNLSGEKKAKVEEEIVDTVISKDPVIDKDLVDITNDEELVAVISAAIAASLGVSVPQVNIKNIRRIVQNTPAWAVAGRQEQIQGKL